jgi:hypothetical protein
MLLFVNDLSIHGQFPDILTFKKAMNQIMTMRKKAKQFGREIFCHRRLASAQISRELYMSQAIQYFDKNERRSVMQWLTRNGPFWEDNPIHSPDEYMECKGSVVTETGIGEAAYHVFLGNLSGLVSFEPSDWLYSPIDILQFKDENQPTNIIIDNYWLEEELESALRSAPMPLDSWEQLKTISIDRFYNLNFTDKAFSSLNGLPFFRSAAHHLIFIFNTLNRLKSCYGPEGNRTPEGHEIYQKFFTGKKGAGGRGAVFSDSSDEEKSTFKHKLTFTHPDKETEKLFCSWHGKVQTPQLRVHFTWPIRTDEPLYIVYIGPKLTKK